MRLVLGWCPELPEGLDPTAFGDIRSFMPGTALRAQGRVPEILSAGSMAEAVAAAAGRPGETVLLSPACASWDMYRNFTERGNSFKALVRTLPG